MFPLFSNLAILVLKLDASACKALALFPPPEFDSPPILSFFLHSKKNRISAILVECQSSLSFISCKASCKTLEKLMPRSSAHSFSEYGNVQFFFTELFFTRLRYASKSMST